MSPKKTKVNQREATNPEDFFMRMVDDDPDAKLLEEIAKKPIMTAEGEVTPDWFTESFDGQLTVDVYQTDKDIVIQAAVAGVRGEDLDLELSNDMVTIKGIRRMKCAVADDDYLIRECYFGGFSRSIILPVDIQHDKVRATLELGLLTVILPKSNKSRHSKISVQEIN